MAERFKVLDRLGAAFKDESPEVIEQETAKALAEVREDLFPLSAEPAGHCRLPAPSV